MDELKIGNVVRASSFRAFERMIGSPRQCDVFYCVTGSQSSEANGHGVFMKVNHLLTAIVGERIVTLTHTRSYFSIDGREPMSPREKAQQKAFIALESEIRSHLKERGYTVHEGMVAVPGDLSDLNGDFDMITWEPDPTMAGADGSKFYMPKMNVDWEIPF